MALAESSRETVHEHTTRGNQIYENRQLFRRSAGYVLPRCRFPTNIAAFEHNGRLYFLFDDTIAASVEKAQVFSHGANGLFRWSAVHVPSCSSLEWRHPVRNTIESSNLAKAALAPTP